MDEIMTPSEVAELFKIHVKTVYKLARQGALSGVRVGRSWRFSRARVLDLLAKQQSKLPEDGERASHDSGKGVQ